MTGQRRTGSFPTKPQSLARPNARLKAELAAKTDRGRRRPRNEDAILVEQLGSGYLLLAVADGMGGAQAGEVASSKAVEGLVEYLRTDALAAPAASLRRAFERINRRLDDLGSSKPELQGMGTTLVAALLQNDQVWLANVGDSRAYMMLGNGLRRITQDHSLVAEQVRAGYLTEEEARESEQRNIITRSLGAQQTVEVDSFGPLRLSGARRLILCSDGLHGALEDEEISQIVVSASPKEAVRRLIRLANKRGGPDNVSVIVYRAAATADDTVLLRAQKLVRHRGRMALGAVMAAAILLAFAAVLFTRGCGLGIGAGRSDDAQGAGSRTVPAFAQATERPWSPPTMTPPPNPGTPRHDTSRVAAMPIPPDQDKRAPTAEAIDETPTPTATTGSESSTEVTAPGRTATSTPDTAGPEGR